MFSHLIMMVLSHYSYAGADLGFQKGGGGFNVDHAK